MSSNGRFARGTDLFNFQGIRRRIFIEPDSTYDAGRFESSTSNDETPFIEDLENVAEKFDLAVRPPVDDIQWRKDREKQRDEIERLGDLVEFYQRKPNLNEFEKRVYKRMIRRDRSMQTEPEIEEKRTSKKNRKTLPKLELPPPAAMEKVEEFLSNNRWRLVDLFRTLDLDKSWTVVKEDFMRFVNKERLEVTEAQAEELLSCFCREAKVPMDYRRFSRGRSAYRKSMRENSSRTTNSSDRLSASNRSMSDGSTNFLKLPTTDTTDHYPLRDVVSSLSRSTISSSAKMKIFSEFN